MILRTRKIGIRDNASPHNTLSLTAINEGVDGSAVFGVSNEHNELTIEGGMTYINSANPSLDVRVLKPSSSDVTQLKSWAENSTDIWVTGITTNGAFMFGGYNGETLENPAKISVNEQLSDADVFAFKVTMQTDVGFNASTGLHQGGFWAGRNLLGNYSWGDADGDGDPNGWTNTGGNYLTTFSSGQVELTQDSATCELERRINFPIVGETLTFSISIDVFNEYGGDYDPRIRLIAYNPLQSLWGYNRGIIC